jgi:integrase
MATGIERRGDAYRAWVWSARDQKRIRRTFPTLAAAKAWRADATSALGRGELRAPAPTTVREAAEAWLKGARDGRITNRSGDRYKPSAVRGYEASLRLRVLPALGDVRLSDIRRVDLQELVDVLRAEGLSPSTVQCTLLPLRAIFRREIARGRLGVNPTSGLELPAVRGGRDRIADPEEAAALIGALPVDKRALWATAMYAGLRRGELMALRDECVDLAAGVIHVHHGWDIKEGEIETKGRNRRRVPIAAVLHDYLAEHRHRMGRAGRLFGPFNPGAVTRSADRAWKRAGLERITLHECRHTFASLMIAAGVNAKALSTYMGHANISITLDRYGHLMPGNEEQAAGLLDTYLARASTATALAIQPTEQENR